MSDSCETRILLLVEDNPGDAELLRAYLDEAGGEDYRTVHAPCMSDALQALEAQSVDVILLDLNLPDCEGLESVRKLHQAASDTPIVVLTGASDTRLALDCMAAGAQDYLEKNELRAHSLRRAIGYATARIREGQLREMQRMLASMRDMSSASQTTTVTAALAGLGTISVRDPQAYYQLVELYFSLIEPNIVSKLPRLQLSRERMEAIATALGDCGAGPRDLLDVHVAALERATAIADERHSRFLVFESRLLALQMMGLLVEYYRVGHRRLFSEGGRL